MSAAALTPKNCSAAGLTKRTVPPRSSAISGLGKAASSAAVSGSAAGRAVAVERPRRNELSIRRPQPPPCPPPLAGEGNWRRGLGEPPPPQAGEGWGGRWLRSAARRRRAAVP